MKVYKITILSFILILFSQISQAANEIYYVTQNGSGTKNGKSADNAWSLENFNDPSWWAKVDNPTKIDPGDTVYLYGTFTKKFVPRGSGTEKGKITIDGRNAKIATAVNDNPKIFDIMNVQYLVLQNLEINGQDNTMSSPGENECTAIKIREFGKPTGHITIQDSVIQRTGSGIVLQGNVSNVNIYRNTISYMSNNGIGVVADNYDGDGRDWYDDCPSYIIVGGSASNGNIFKDIGKLAPSEWVDYEGGYKGGAVPGYTLGTLATDLVFSYNQVYATLPDVGCGIYMNGAKRVLIEYNVIHSLESVSHRSYITFKNDDWFFTEDIIIRFNKIYDVYDGPNQYAPPGDAIRISGEGKNRIIHANYCQGAGINLNWNWSADNDGVGGDGYYVWGNIINGTARGGGISINGSSLNKDSFKNFYIYNNTIYRAARDLVDESYFYAINTSFDSTKNILKNINVKNNILVDSRPKGKKYINLSMSYIDSMAIGYNHHESSGHVPLVYFDGTDCKPCAWNSSKLPEGFGKNDTAGDPKFRNADRGDFTLLSSSPCIDSGEDLSADNAVMPIITIMGKQYKFSFAEVLDPLSTKWSEVPPVVVIAEQSRGGKWEKGAYVFVSDKKLYSPTNLNIKK